MTIKREAKINRILNIYSRLEHEQVVNKKEMAMLFNVNEKTIQRDIDDIRTYIYENRETSDIKDIVYKRDKKGYCFLRRDDVLTREDILAIIKILLESRAFCNEEINHLIKVILKQINEIERKYVNDIIGNELFNYVPLNHNSLLLSKIWNLSEFVRNKDVIKINYSRNDVVEVQRIIKPVAIIFSEYYFYLIAYFNNFDSPTIFRIDRIKDYKNTGEKFYIPYSKRFEDGEFRKRVQFMYSGKLMKIKFEFFGNAIDAILDRIPTARIVDKYKDRYVIEAEVYGKGIIMWILSQGSKLKVISSNELVKDVVYEVEKISELYKNG